MKTSKLFLTLLILPLLFSCNRTEEDMETVYTMADFEGSWIAISNVHTNNSNSSETFDIIENGGEIRFTAFADGRMRTWIEFGTFSDEFDALAKIDDDTVTLTPAESSRLVQVYTFTFENEMLRLTNTNDTFDFTLSGGESVSTTSVTEFIRN